MQPTPTFCFRKGPRTELGLESFCVSSFNLFPHPMPDSGHCTCYRTIFEGQGVALSKKSSCTILKVCREVSLNARIFVKCAFNNGRRVRRPNGGKAWETSGKFGVWWEKVILTPQVAVLGPLHLRPSLCLLYFSVLQALAIMDTLSWLLNLDKCYLVS